MTLAIFIVAFVVVVVVKVADVVGVEAVFMEDHFFDLCCFEPGIGLENWCH